MNTPTWIHLQLISYRTHNLLDFKWTNPYGEKLTRFLAMLNVKILRTQKNLISHREHFLCSTLVCICFLSLLSCNQTLASKGESRLPTLNKSNRTRVQIHQQNTQKRPKKKTKKKKKQKQTNRRVKRRIMGKLCS